MNIGWFRDLVICIAGLVAAGVLIFIAVLLYSLYCRTRTILDSMQARATIGDEVLQPLIQVVTLVQGIRQGIDAVSKFFKKKEGGKDV